MNLNLKALTAGTAALLVAGSAMAADPVNMVSGTGNSSLAFVAMDNNGTPASLFVDLGYLFSDFAPGAAVLNPGNSISWNFNTNSVTVNGSARAGTYNYSTQLNAFMQIAQAADVTYGVIAGSAVNYPDKFLTTGLPTAAEIAAQGTGADNMRLVSGYYNKQAGLGTFTSPGYGAVALNGSDANAANQFGNFGPGGNWQTNLAWNATVAQATANNLYFLEGDGYTVTKLAGQFNYDNGVLNFQSSPIPEPSAFMMALAGLAVLGYAGRRREPR